MSGHGAENFRAATSTARGAHRRGSSPQTQRTGHAFAPRCGVDRRVLISWLMLGDQRAAAPHPARISRCAMGCRGNQHRAGQPRREGGRPGAGRRASGHDFVGLPLLEERRDVATGPNPKELENDRGFRAAVEARAAAAEPPARPVARRGAEWLGRRRRGCVRARPRACAWWARGGRALRGVAR
jgi:hypothetical protein